MNKIKSSHLFSFLIFLIAAGLTIAIVGVYVVDGSSSPDAEFEAYHDFDRDNIKAEETKSTIYGSTFSFYLQGDESGPVASPAERGVSVGEMMRWAGIFSIFLALVILLLIEFIYKDRMNRMNYRVLLIISLFVLPVIIGLGTSVTVLETTKTVQSCGSCHVMDPFVNDLYDPESSTLAARHFKNRWISEYQCYTCHTTYGAHGTFEGKRDGFRHWLLFVTQTWEDPITYAGSYPNMNCTACHGGTTAFRDIPSHQALSSKLRADEVSCTSCHGPAHPTPAERPHVPGMEGDERASIHEIDKTDLTNLMEAFHGNDE
jgi:cytochrome c nitrite reductase small subunit